MFNFSDPETMWLNLTNAGLGLCCAICILVAAVGIFRDVMAKARLRAAAREFELDPHSLMMPDLGFTMADGGEPISKDDDQKNKKR